MIGAHLVPDPNQRFVASMRTAPHQDKIPSAAHFEAKPPHISAKR
jgi:hypothetical protein